MKKRYIFQNTTNKWAIITSIDELIYANYKNIAKYGSKYYAFKSNIKDKNITIKDAFKIQMFNNLSLAFKTYRIVINNWMQKNEQLEEDKVLLKAIEKE